MQSYVLIKEVIYNHAKNALKKPRQYNLELTALAEIMERTNGR
tara:strand:- start:853 stop:981 length:129 start_codon:yes stop_codon:yes gene_type:complete